VDPGEGGHNRVMDEPSTAPDADVRAGHAEPIVEAVMRGDTVRLTLTGELTDAARRPLVRAVTDLLLAEPPPQRETALHRIELDLRAVPFVNSAGVAVLVQVQRLAAPRAIEVVLVDPPPAVTRPLQLSGLWHRFPITDDGKA
jgi:anti-anti-sigma factor